ncbi:acyl-phosphate glycerol 3-phosphate acyltransferase [Novibacillus thermophilus]|uniref:Glycerol-3-phosphate acyltransferase n=2 Tax=Novibacillus thermophilus TaxID=1471761 RepID=A0A1U9K9B1_9BACL|nr:acyl-phosphate glycerol 3-phosphate acyltransferase [Novibacillus thermophilus]
MMVLVALIGAYLLGSISSSYLVAKKWAGIDIRQHGSGNAGATNTLRVVGKWAALLVFVLDIAKAMIAVGLGYALTQDETVMFACGFAAIVGHNWPVFFQFRGGKGVAATIGVAAMMVFFPALIVGVIAVLSIVVTRYVSLGSIIFAVGLPFSVWLANEPPSFVWISAGIALLTVFRHRSNIQRLIQGTENRIGQRPTGGK